MIINQNSTVEENILEKLNRDSVCSFFYLSFKASVNSLLFWINKGPPDAGGKPAVCEVKADSVTLTWYGSVYDGGSVVTGYAVEVCQQDEETWKTLTSE